MSLLLADTIYIAVSSMIQENILSDCYIQDEGVLTKKQQKRRFKLFKRV